MTVTRFAILLLPVAGAKDSWKIFTASAACLLTFSSK